MKKLAFVFAFALLISGMSFAQEGEAPLAKGDKQLNFGVGLAYSTFPIYVGMDFAVHNDITVGGQIGLDMAYFDWISLMARGDYHFNRIIGIPKDFDFYAGAGVGVNIGMGGHSTGVGLNLHVGGRWYWSDKWGLNLEIGGGTTFGGLLGVSMKF